MKTFYALAFGGEIAGFLGDNGPQSSREIERYIYEIERYIYIRMGRWRR